MNQKRFQYLLTMQSVWRKQYAIQEREVKQQKKELFNSKKYYKKNRSDVDTSL